MYRWDIFYEDEKTGKRTRLGEVRADSMAEALQQAAEYFEYDIGDLVAIQK